MGMGFNFGDWLIDFKFKQNSSIPKYSMSHAGGGKSGHCPLWQFLSACRYL